MPRGKTQVKTSGIRSGCSGRLQLLLCLVILHKYPHVCCCIAVWTVESNHDLLSPICRNRLCISGLGISSHTGFSLEFPKRSSEIDCRPRLYGCRWSRSTAGICMYYKESTRSSAQLGHVEIVFNTVLKTHA